MNEKKLQMIQIIWPTFIITNGERNSHVQCMVVAMVASESVNGLYILIDSIPMAMILTI